jgi:hypothetical protein
LGWRSWRSVQARSKGCPRSDFSVQKKTPLFFSYRKMGCHCGRSARKIGQDEESHIQSSVPHHTWLARC